jgi:hypothetical protein
LTRQSIIFEDVFGSAMDTRGKPAYDIVIKSRHVQFTGASAATAANAPSPASASVSDTGKCLRQ